MITSTVQLKDLYRHLRIDAEFYKPEYIHLECELEKKEKIKPLKQFCHYIKKGIFDISPEIYTESGVPLIRTSEIKNPLINFSTTVFLSPDTHQEHFKTELFPGDIVVTKIGAYIGDVALLPEKYEKYNFSQNVTGLRVKQKSIEPAYLFAFLLSKYGHSRLKRIIMLSGQGKIELEDIRDINVYEASASFQKAVADVIKRTQTHIRDSDQEFHKAQTILLSELGLTNWQPKHQIAFVKNYSDTEQVERIDAEYFQPKYEAIIKAIKAYKGGWDRLGDLVTVKKSVEVGRGEYLYEGIPFVRVSNLSRFEIIEEKYISENLYAEIEQHQPKQGEILFSKDGTPGIAHYLDAPPRKMIPSGGILRLKSNTSKINNEYLTLVLNSILVKEQINRDVGGSIILHWRPDQVKETVIPILAENKQAEIQGKVIESLSLRRKSKHLLECAKRAVEIAIEQDEQTAISWLKDQVED